MRLKKGKIEDLKGNVLIYSIYNEKFKSLGFSSIDEYNTNGELFDDGTVFGIYLTDNSKNIEDKFLDFPKTNVFSYILENSVSEAFKKKILASYHGKELVMTSKQLIFNSKKELLKHFKQVDEIILSGKFNMVPLCMYSNNLNLEDYIIEFIYQKNSDLMINVQNKSYEEASSEEIGQIVTGYFDKMSQALVCRDQGEFKDTKRKLLDFAAESPSKDYIPKICDLLLEADKKQSSMIGYHFTLMMQAVENQEYLIAGHHKKRLTEIENTLNEKQITNILKLGIKKINHQQ